MTLLKEMTPDELRAEYQTWRQRFDASRGPYGEYRPGLCMTRMAFIEAVARARRINLEGDPHPTADASTVRPTPGSTTPPVGPGQPEREEAAS